jgi:hypothetical protein
MKIAQHIWLSQVIALAVCSGTFAASDSPAIIYNEEKGIWDQELVGDFEFVPEITIGSEEDDEHYLFGRILDIAVDSDDDVYVLDNGFGRVRKYSSDGIYLQNIGREGEGPGEFQFPTAIAVDDSTKLYVAASGKVSVFDSSGDFKKQFKLGVPGNIVRSVRTAGNGECLISCFDILDQMIIHRYNANHERVLSFCESYAMGDNIDVRIEQVYAGGAIDTDKDGSVYFTQITPYEIRKFSSEGVLLARIYRDNSFMTPPVVEEEGSSITFTMPPTCSSILVLNDGNIMNVVLIPVGENQPPKTLVDLFDKEGTLLTSRTLDRSILPKRCDSTGRIYAIDYDEFPSVTGYRLVLRNNE